MQLVEDLYCRNVPWDDPRIPRGFCPTCFGKFQGWATLPEGSPRPTEIPELADFSQVVVFPPMTRAAAAAHCCCLICQVHHPGGIGKVSPLTATVKKDKGGAPKKPRLAKVVSMCTGCLQVGATADDGHKCTSAALTQNLHQIAQQHPQETERVVSSFLKAKTSSPKGSKYLSQPNSGRKVAVTLGRASEPGPSSSTISVDAMVTMQKAGHLPMKAMKDMRAIFNRDAGRRIVAPGLEKILNERASRLEHHFVKSLKTFEEKPYYGKEFPVYHVKDLHNFIDEVAEIRGVARSTLLARLVMDEGQGVLKISLNLIDLTAERYQANGKTRVSRPVGDFLDSGVEKILLPCYCRGLKETHETVSVLMKLINVREAAKAVRDADGELGEFYFVPDFKMGNLTAGLMQHSSTFPCTWCNVNKSSLKDCGPTARTFGMIRDNNMARIVEKGEGKDFECCVADPPIGEDDQEVIDLIVPGELHILLGVVSTLVMDIEEADPPIWPQIDEWYDRLNIIKSPRAGCPFPGNTCKLLISKKGVEALEELIVSHGVAIDMQPYVDVFKCLDAISHKCFGNHLHPDWKEEINKFSEVFEAVHRYNGWTPKMHALVHHVPEFISAKERPRPLGIYSEQAGESVHHNYKVYFEKRYKKLPKSAAPDHELRALVRYNSENL